MNPVAGENDQTHDQSRDATPDRSPDRSSVGQPAPRRRSETTPGRRLRFAAFSLLPALLMLAAAEIGVRALGLARPSLRSLPLPAESFGYVESDPDLFWAPVPNVSQTIEIEGLARPMVLHTNSLGLRHREIGPKEPDEYRILSLGESTTFGAMVSDDQTYSARLETLLNGPYSPRTYRVINAGVGAWSSFQSLTYLKERGVALEPDMVLFYHEYNDYLPSSLRGGDNTEVGLARTDRELHRARRGVVGWLAASSALVRTIQVQLARRSVDAFAEGDGASQGAPTAIGLREIGALPTVVAEGGDEPVEMAHETLPRRVSPTERRVILEELAAFCEENGIALVVIHPSYRDTTRHRCVLTEFVRESGVEMFDAQPHLHPPAVPPGRMYLDAAHPSPEGHDRLARGLAPMVRRLSAEGD